MPVAGPPSGDSDDSSESEVKVVSAFGGGGGLLASGSPPVARTMPQGLLLLGVAWDPAVSQGVCAHECVGVCV